MTTAKKPTRAVKSSSKKKPATRKKPANPKSGNNKPATSKPNFKQKLWSWFWRLSILVILGLGIWLIYLDAQVRSQFDGNKWTLPAKVYARPLSLYPGLLLSTKQLKAELQWNDYKAVSHVVSPGTYGRDGSDWIIYRRAFSFADRQEGAVKIRLSFSDGRIEQLSINGQVKGLERIEPQYIGGIFPAHHEDRDLIALQDVPPALVAALVAVEDRGYFDHYGVSIRGILRAMKANIAAGRTVQGGSTLTQQLVKNFFLTNERSLKRKVKEAFMALLLELHYSKEEILQAYLNEVYLGQSGRRSINGIALASRFYFAKNVQQLDLSEVALLVGMVKGPSYYNPFRHPERARERRNLVLGVMAELNIISNAQRINAQGQSIQVADSGRAGQREYPAFIQLVKKQLQQDYRLQDLQSTGLRIFTTLDPWLQHATEEAVQKHIKNLEKRIGFKQPTLEAAAVVTSVDGAEVRAIVGSRRVRYFGFNRAMDAQRSIGSLAKPAVYLTALASGRYNWSTIVDDKPVSVSGQDGSLWQPKNYDRKDYGPIFLVDAMSKSLNQATARLGMKIGIDQVVNTFQRLGVEKKIPHYPSILLGSVSMSPFQVTQMFQTYASGGFAMQPRSIQALTTNDNKVLTSYAAQGEQVYSPQLIENLRYGLQQVIVQGTGKRLARTFNTTKIAGKTGTSDDQRDAWFAGFDDRHLAVIWVGRDDNKPMPFTGAGGALPIWQDIFLQSGLEPLTPLVDLDWAWVNTQGEVVERECGVRKMPFMAGVLDGRKMSCDESEANLESESNSQLNNSKGGRSWFDWLF
jgi:penicillin-binding protein 1B